MRNKLLLLLLILLSFPAFSQSDRVKSLTQEAITLMDKGELDASVSLLQEALKIDSKNATVIYELGLAYYHKQDYKKALEVTAPLLKDKKASDQVYQIRGNCYDMLGDRSKAIKTYEDGLKKFPNSGALYLESGIVMLKSGDKNKALGYFEQGIAAAPKHPSNYYWAAKLFLESNEEVWGMLYGEIFRNLEPNSKRSAELSKLLFDTYKREIKYTSDSTISVSFSKNNVIGYNDKKSSFNLPFGTIAYEPTLAIAVAGTKQIDLATLHQIRTNFTETFYKNDISTRFDNLVFKWHQTLIEQGKFEAYNYWLLGEGAEDEYTDWLQQNEAKLNSFVDWYNNNDFPVSSGELFYRNHFDNVSLTAGE